MNETVYCRHVDKTNIPMKLNYLYFISLILLLMNSPIDAQKTTHTPEAIRKAMDHLIDRATNYDIEALETIYHQDFHTTLVMPDGKVITYDKEAFKKHFEAQAGKSPLNTWADWHDFHILGNSAVCILTRKHSGMNGEEMNLYCNIELRYEDNRWQVIREAIFLRPLTEE